MGYICGLWMIEICSNYVATESVFIVSGFMISVLMVAYITKIAKASLDKALAENDEIDGFLSSPQLPIVGKRTLDLQKPLSEQDVLLSSHLLTIPKGANAKSRGRAIEFLESLTGKLIS
ncbi:hypothetical protein F0562_000105 [Nyssa sinensis]|uniref:Uncharacterized protein n=1 Tax=Nyssa sinensis TaxID=561372 RepID=A0A5J5C490_9ASTE|nr:hypothetical protein F0562_000105 [Nyssa sinensis]